VTAGAPPLEQSGQLARKTARDARVVDARIDGRIDSSIDSSIDPGDRGRGIRVVGVEGANPSLARGERQAAQQHRSSHGRPLAGDAASLTVPHFTS
jgi:hypothetical protein